MNDITLRDLFAMMATDKDVESYTADMSKQTYVPAGKNSMTSWEGHYVYGTKSREEARYMYADAMMKQRDRK